MFCPRATAKEFEILELIGYENRILKSYDDFKIAEEKIDFDRVNEIISTERKKSFDILKDMIGDEL